MSLTVKSLLGLWPTQEVLASDIGASVSAVRKWLQRGSIPSEYWYALVVTAEMRGISGVTLEALATLHARRPVEARV